MARTQPAYRHFRDAPDVGPANAIDLNAKYQTASVAVQLADHPTARCAPGTPARKAVALLRLNFQVQRPHIGPLPCPEPINT